MYVSIPLDHINRLRDSLTETCRRIALRAETDRRKWAPWSSYPIGRIIESDDAGNAILARTIDDFTGTIVGCDYPTFLNLVQDTLQVDFRDLPRLLATIGRSVFIPTPFLPPSHDTMLGFMLNINDIESPDYMGVAFLPFYDQRPTQEVHWGRIPVSDAFDRRARHFGQPYDTLTRVGLHLWALAAYQTQHDVEPITDGPFTNHVVTPPSPLIKNRN